MKDNISTAIKYYCKGEYKKALRLYFKELSDDIENYILYYNIALTYEDMKEYELAVSNYRYALKLNPDDIRSVNNLARIYFEVLDDETTSRKYLDYAIENYPTDAEAYNIYGKICFKHNDFKKAQLFFQKSINFDKDYFKNYYDIAKAYIGLDDYENAKKSLEKCLELKPDYELAKTLLLKLK